MRRWLTTLIAVTLLGAPAAQAKLRVAATVPDLAALAAAVGGDRVEVFALTLPTQDPHFVDARPHLALQLNRANLLLSIGLQLEVGWLPVLLRGARNPALQPGSPGYLDAGALVRLKEVPAGPIDRSMGDIHPGGNPHYLTDPENALRVAQAIAERLGRLDTPGALAYRQNAARFAAELRAAEKRWAAQVAPYRGTPIVVYHSSWIYFADVMGLRIVAHLEPKPGIPPSAAHVLQVIQLMRQQRVPIVLQEEYYPDRTAQLVCQKTGARLLILPGGADLRRGQSYLQRIDAMVRALVEALKGSKR